MSMFSVSNGIWLDRKLQELEDKADRSDKLEILEWLDNELMESRHLFAYLVKVDRLGYLKALAKAKALFRELYREFDFNKMIDGSTKKKHLNTDSINTDFVATIDDIYYSEIRPDATNRVDLKLARYNALRDELIERTENDKNAYRNYAQIEFNITRAEMFDKLRSNELVWVLAVKNNTWCILDKEWYKQNAEINTVSIHYPLELCS